MLYGLLWSCTRFCSNCHSYSNKYSTGENKSTLSIWIKIKKFVLQCVVLSTTLLIIPTNDLIEVLSDISSFHRCADDKFKAFSGWYIQNVDEVWRRFLYLFLNRHHIYYIYIYIDPKLMILKVLKMLQLFKSKPLIYHTNSMISSVTRPHEWRRYNLV